MNLKTNLELRKFSPTEFKMKLAIFFVFVFALVSVALAYLQDKPQQQRREFAAYKQPMTNICRRHFGEKR